MSKTLMWIVALAVVFFIGLFVSVPPPLNWVRDGAIVVLSALSAVQWVLYSQAKHPGKVEKFAMQYLPADEVKDLVEGLARRLPIDEIEAMIGTGGFGDMVVDAAKRLNRL